MNEKRAPIPLTDEQGTIRAWACPRCFRVSVSVSCGGADGRQREAEHSRERAEECGVCRDCGVVVGCHLFGRLCETCRAKADARTDVWREQHRVEWEQQAAEHRASRDRYLSGLLADLTALRARDWSDEEDLAVDLMPKVLDRLAALEATEAQNTGSSHV